MFAGGNAVKRLGLQQRRHPVAGHVEAVAAQFGDFVLAGLIPGQQHVEQIAVDHDVFEVDRGARGEFSRQTRRERRARFRGAGAYRCRWCGRRRAARPARDQVEGALVGVAFLEQHAAGGQFANRGSCGQARAGFPPSVRRAARRSSVPRDRAVVHPSSNSPPPMVSTL